MSIQSKPKILILCAREHVRYAIYLQIHLSENFDVFTWRDVFPLSSQIMDQLRTFPGQYDFVIILATPVAYFNRGDGEIKCPGLNIILEIGFFFGGLSLNRTLLFCPDSLNEIFSSHISNVAGIIRGPLDYKDHATDEYISDATQKVAEQVRKHIASTWPKLVSERLYQFVAAICFKIVENNVYFRLVKTDHNRRIFPKGRNFPLSSDLGSPALLEEAALHYAKVEAGIEGKVIELPERLICRYYNHEKREVELLHLIVIQRILTTSSAEIAREPDWYNFDEAKWVLTQNRDIETSNEFSKYLNYINNFLKRNNFEVSQGSGITFRKEGSNWKYLLVTRRNNARDWIFPRGTKFGYESLVECAERETQEEGGVRGKIIEREFDRYFRRNKNTFVHMFPFEVTEVIGDEDWSECGMRIRKWFTKAEALKIIRNREIKNILERFDPSMHT